MTDNTFVHVSEKTENLLNKLRRIHNARVTREQSDERGARWASEYWSIVENALKKRLNSEG